MPGGQGGTLLVAAEMLVVFRASPWAAGTTAMLGRAPREEQGWGVPGVEKGVTTSPLPLSRREEDAAGEAEPAADHAGLRGAGRAGGSAAGAAPRAARLEELSSRFYTIVPHNFGRARPSPIDSPDLLRAKKDMLLVRCCPASGEWHPSPWGREAVPWQGPWSRVTVSLLGPCQVLADIEVAQSLQAQKAEEEEEEVAHPLDQDYALLCCQLSLPDPASREHQVQRSPRARRDHGHCGEPGCAQPSECHLLGGVAGTRLDGCLR